MGMNANKQRIRGKLSRVKSQSTENQFFPLWICCTFSQIELREGKISKRFITIDMKISSSYKGVVKL